MTTATNTEGLTKQEVLDLGFSNEDIVNAKYFDYYMVMPDIRFLEEFDTTVLYKVMNNIVYVDTIQVLYNGYRLELYINSNYKSQYSFSILDNTHRVNYPMYSGKNAVAFKKKTIIAMLVHHTTEYKKALEIYKNNKNAYDATVEKLTKLGFKMHGTDKAYTSSKLFDVEVNIYENGHYTIRQISKRYDVDNDVVLDIILSH